MGANYSTDISQLPDDIGQHFGLENGELMLKAVAGQTFYCKDSRGEEANFGAAGGDFGEFLLACSEFAKRASSGAGKKVDSKALLAEWISLKCTAKRPFYLHTDQAALNRVFEHMKPSPPSTTELRQLSAQEQAAFMEALCHGPSAFHGCGHLRLIHEQPANFGIDKSLLNELLSAFFEHVWQGNASVLLKVYQCDLEGSAVVIVDGPLEKTDSPVGIQRLRNGHQCFILNQHAVSVFRKQHLTPFFVQKMAAGGGGREDVEEDFFQALERRGWENAMRTAEALAAGKPVYHLKLV